MRFSMLYSGEQNLSFKSCLVFYAGDSLSPQYTCSSSVYEPSKEVKLLMMLIGRPLNSKPNS